MNKKIADIFSLKDKVIVITGGAGLLGVKHAEIVIEAGGIPVLLDIHAENVKKQAASIMARYKLPALGLQVDITKKNEIKKAVKIINDKWGRIDVLINNAANNPKVEGKKMDWSRFENFSIDDWQKDLAVGLTGAFLCSQVIGQEMQKRGQGVILNIASDLAIIAPDQRIYRIKGLKENRQPVKPVTYSVVKSALIGLTRYLATYWADDGIRVNALLPGGVENNQSPEFMDKLTKLIPMRRMAGQNEYKGAVLFLISPASSYMTGANLVVDGGRTCW